MNRDFFPSMPEKVAPLVYGKRTGLPLVCLIDIKRDTTIPLTGEERGKIQADIDELIGMKD